MQGWRFGSRARRIGFGARPEGASPWAAAAIALSLLAASPASAETRLTRGMIGGIETLDPQKAATANETAILLDLFEGLVTRDALGRTVPGAAESWTVSPDGLTYTFRLREGARWSSGEAVKAEDFVASFRRLFDPATEATEAGLLNVIRNAKSVQEGTAKPDTLGVEAVDPLTLVITLETPTPTFPARLALPAALPLNVPSIKKFATNFSAGTKIISNGAYQVGMTGKKDGVQLQKNPRYRAAESVSIDSLAYRSFETAADCVTAYRAGEVQSCAAVPTETLAELKQEFGGALRVAPYAGTYFYVFNTSHKPFDDPNVRKALDLAIDRETLAKEAWSGGMVPASTLIPPGLSGHAAPSAEPLAARQAKAQTLLEKAGFRPDRPNGRTLHVEIRVGTGTAHEKAAEIVAGQWRAIGVEAVITTEPNGEHFARLRDGGDFEIGRAGWIADEVDPIDMLKLMTSDNRFNYARYRNPEFDGLVAKAGTEMDEAKRLDDLEAAEAILATDAPILPVLGYAALELVSPGLSGWNDNILDQHPTRFMSLAN